MNTQRAVNFQRVLMDGIQDIVFIINVIEQGKSFTYDFLNRAAFEKTHLTTEVIGKSINEVYPSKEAQFLIEHYNSVLINNDCISYEDSYLSPEGNRIYSQTVLTPLVDSEGRCEQIVGIVKDTTKEKLTDSAIKKYLYKMNESRSRYRSLFYYNSDAILTIDLEGRIVSGNPAVEDMTSVLLDELIGSDFKSLVHADYLDMVEGYLREALRDSNEHQISIVTNLGEQVEVLVKFTPIIVQDETVGIFAIIKDISEIKRLGKRYEESENRFRIIAEHAQDLITLIDKDGNISYVSPSYKKILGYHYKEYVGKSFLHNIHPEYKEELKEGVSTSIQTKQPCKLKFKQKTQCGKWMWTELNATPVYNEYGRFIYMVVVSRDISIQKDYEAKLEHFAYHDSLSSLPNRRMFKESLTDAIVGLKEHKERFSVLLMDIDHFKQINDVYGHDAGDEVIKEFGRRIKQSCRGEDVVARLGGDEFAILLKGVYSEEKGAEVAERIQAALKEPWQLKSCSPAITSSIGIAISPVKDTTIFAMFKNADKALYEAKDAGRNTFKIKVVKEE